MDRGCSSRRHLALVGTGSWNAGRRPFRPTRRRVGNLTRDSDAPRASITVAGTVCASASVRRGGMSSSCQVRQIAFMVHHYQRMGVRLGGRSVWVVLGMLGAYGRAGAQRPVPRPEAMEAAITVGPRLA